MISESNLFASIFWIVAMLVINLNTCNAGEFAHSAIVFDPIQLKFLLLVFPLPQLHDIMRD